MLSPKFVRAVSGAAQVQGGGTISLGGFTLTVPAAGTVALLGVSNVFTAAQLLPDGTLFAPALSFSSQTGLGIYRPAANDLAFSSQSIVTAVLDYPTTFRLSNTFSLSWSSAASALNAEDLSIGRESAAILQQGADSSSPIAQTFKGPDGSGSNIAGGNMTLAAGRGTGTGLGGSLILATAPAGASGSAQNDLVSRATVAGDGTVTIHTGPLVLPAGSDSAPAMKSPIDSTGIYWSTAELRTTIGGTSRAFLGATQIGIYSLTGSFVIGNPADVFFGRDSSGYPYLLKNSALTNTVALFTLRHNSSGTPAAGYGSALVIQGKSSTTDDQDMLRLTTTWVVATHGSRTSRTVWNQYDTAAREIMRGEASGSAPMVGFLGAAAAVQQTGGAQTAGMVYGATEQDMLQKAYNALRTFGYLS